MLPALQSIDALVVRCPNWVGDVVMATSVFECLRHNFPEATIAACVRPYARGILEDCPWIDQIIDCDDKSLAGIKSIRKSLGELQPQAGLLLTNTTHSFLTFKVAGVPQVYGYRRNWRKFFLTGGPQPQMQGRKFRPLPMQDYYLELCNYLGLELPESPKPKLFVSEQLGLDGANRLSRYGIQPEDKVIGLNPGASFGSSKCWPAAHFARLAELLQAQQACKLLLLVGPGEEAIAADIVQQSQASIINTASDKISLAELKPLVQRCDLLITNDTGPRHYAVAFDIPNIVLMGPTNPLYTASNLERTVVLRKDLPCAPCHQKTCPLQHHACMVDIEPAAVAEAASKILKGNKH
jgi:heptosyltransferase-2